MKTFVKITLLATGLAATLATLPFANAADDGTVAPAAAAGRHPRLRALMQRQAVRQRIAQRLDLSADQKAQLKAARASTAAAVKAIRTDASLTTEQKKAKVRETLQATRTQLRGVLTTDQQAKLGQLRAQIRERLQARRAR